MPRGRPLEPNSKSGIARRNGVSHTAVCKAVKSGRIDVSQPADVIDQAWKANADLQQMLRGLGIDHVPKDYAAAQTALEQLKVHEKALKLQMLAASMVEREEVNREYYEVGKRLREGWEQWPARVSSEMANRLGVKAHLMQEVLTEFVKANLAGMKKAEVLRLRSDKKVLDAAA